MASELEHLALFELVERVEDPNSLVSWARGVEHWSAGLGDKLVELSRMVVLNALRESDSEGLDQLARALNRLRHPTTGLPEACTAPLAEHRSLCLMRARRVAARVEADHLRWLMQRKHVGALLAMVPQDGIQQSTARANLSISPQNMRRLTRLLADHDVLQIQRSGRQNLLSRGAEYTAALATQRPSVQRGAAHSLKGTAVLAGLGA